VPDLKTIVTGFKWATGEKDHPNTGRKSRLIQEGFAG
jgi:hypothetical protein